MVVAGNENGHVFSSSNWVVPLEEFHKTPVKATCSQLGCSFISRMWNIFVEMFNIKMLHVYLIPFALDGSYYKNKKKIAKQR